MNSARPVAARQRLIEPDMLRGIALFGILLVNMWGYAEPQLYLSEYELYGKETWDGAVYSIVLFLAQGKFYTMFSFLFGFGFFLFMTKAESSHPRPQTLALRRMSLLLALGLLHAFLLWWGDILITYAIAGTLLLFFWTCRGRTLVIWAAGLWSVFVLIAALSVLVSAVSESMMPGEFAAELERMKAEERQAAAESYRQYAGDWFDVQSRRLKDSMLMLSYQPYAVLFNVLPMALLGVAAAKAGWLQRLRSDRGRALRVCLGLLGIGLPLNLLKQWSAMRMDPVVPGAADVWNAFASAFGDPAMCLFYMTAAMLLCWRAGRGTDRIAGRFPGVLAKWFRCLASAGRASLSNYLLQSIVCTTVFYGYGFGMYGRWSAAMLAGFAILLFVVQVLCSHLWFRRYSFGPLEWLLRAAVYLRRPERG